MEIAPRQQRFDDNDDEPQKRSWAWTGVDLDKWERDAKPPAFYDPPQLKAGKNSFIPWVNWWNWRSPLCAEPWLPCNLACCLRKCIAPDAEVIRFDQPDEWMIRMLSTGTSPNCPDELKGLYWTNDNNPPGEFLLTIHDADWKTDQLAQKDYSRNFSTGTNIFGTCGLVGAKLFGVKLHIQMSPNKKWINLGGDQLGGWIYRPSPGEKFKLPEGGYLEPEAGEMMRLTAIASDADNPNMNNGILRYQYRVRKVAYLDSEGKLVKTAAWDDFKKYVDMPLKYDPCCCGYCWCLSKEQLALKNFPMLPTKNAVRFAVPPPGAV